MQAAASATATASSARGQSQGKMKAVKVEKRATAASSLSTSASAGLMTGATCRFVCAPLDVLKIRGQTHVGEHQSMVRTVKSLLREEGIVALWRGNTPAFALWTSFAAIQFPIHQLVRDDLLAGRSNRDVASFLAALPEVSQQPSPHTLLTFFVHGTHFREFPKCTRLIAILSDPCTQQRALRAFTEVSRPLHCLSYR